MNGQPTRWRAAIGQRICVNAWEDGYTVFHGGSGDTHLLDPFTGRILSCLLRQPMSLDELARSVAGKPLDELDAETARALDDALAALHRVHVIDPSPDCTE